MKSDLASVTEAYATLAMIGGNGNYYLRANIMEKLYGAGTWFKNDSGTYNVDVQYDTTGAKKGLMDMPLFIRCAMARKMGPASVNTAFLFGQNFLVKDNFKCKLGDNVTATVTSCYDIKEVLTNTMNAKLNLGVGAEFKI